MTKILSKQDIQLHHMASTCTFPLFWHKDKLFRSYIPTEEGRFKKILSLNLPEIQEATKTEFLVDLSDLATLVDLSKLNDFVDFIHLDGYAPVYEHKNYVHRVRIQETYPELMKQIISTICKMNAKLVEHNMIAVDTHEANINVTIDGIKWLDYGSIKEIDGYLTLRSFVETSYLIGRYLLHTYKDIQGRINIDFVRGFHEELKNISDMDLSAPDTWLKLSQFVENLPTTELQYTHWSDEYTLESDIDRPESRNGKGKGYWDLLQEIEFETVTDIACNKGYFGFLAAKKAKSVIGFDYVPKCISMAYQLNETFKLPIIFAAKSVEDFISNENYETSRYKSDLVVALAIVHHIKIPASDFVKMIDSICNKYVIIEDITNAAGYEELFVEQGYELVKRIDSSPSPRTLSLYKKL